MLIDVFHEYNIVPPIPSGSHFVTWFCEAFMPVCEFFSHAFFHHHGVDNPKLLPVAAANVPSGQSYRCFVYYAQMINTGRMALYDYGKKENKKRYDGSKTPPIVPLVEKYKVPTALLSGSMDHLADPKDVAQLAIDLGSNLVFNHQYDFDHMSFVVAKDMTYMPQDVIPLLKKYNPLPVNEEAPFLQ